MFERKNIGRDEKVEKKKELIYWVTSLTSFHFWPISNSIHEVRKNSIHVSSVSCILVISEQACTFILSSIFSSWIVSLLLDGLVGRRVVGYTRLFYFDSPYGQ